MKTLKPRYRVLVTGTRGKSTASRYLAAAFDSVGIPCSARVTGTIPVIIDRGTERSIIRSGPAHMDEMRWWLQNIPSAVSAVVAENSAVSPELQQLPGTWLNPGLVVWTTLLPDHLEHWGPSLRGARDALLKGVPEGSKVLLGPQAASDQPLISMLKAKKCLISRLTGNWSSYTGQYESLARMALDILGLSGEKASFMNVTIDPHEFGILRPCGGGKIAWAFSSNDPDTAKMLFGSLGWESADTVLLFNHRKDRPSRLISHLPWIQGQPWKEIRVMGDRPLHPFGFQYEDLDTPGKISSFVSRHFKVFGCGNIRGLPLPSEVKSS